MSEAIKYLSMPLFITAAYGRSYATAEAALCAWREGKDFQILHGPYCSIRDIEDMKVEYPSGIYIITDEGFAPVA